VLDHRHVRHRRLYNRRVADDPAIGSNLAGYRLDALIARGGMGVVYRATHLALDRPVALKVIARQFAGDQGFRDRFLRESRLAARLDHPAVVPVFDAREEDGELIVAMRLIAGGDLKKRIKVGGPLLPPAEAVELLGQVAGALDAAHAAGIVHRDVKPHNLLLEGDRAYLTDFGLAKALGDSGVLSGASIVGTVEYMSPEQWRGEQVGPAADIYSLGCVLYECLTGVVPYARQAGGVEPQMPKGLDQVIERAVARDPAQRFGTAGELVEAARECQGATPAVTQALTDPAERPTLGRADGGGAPQHPHVGWRDRVAGAPRQWLGALVAVLAGAIALAFLLLGGGGPSVSAPIAVGDPPLRLAVGPETVWVTSAPDGTLSGIDPETGQVRSRMRVGRGASGVAIGAGSVWVSNPRTGEVLRIDPIKHVTVRIPVGGSPGAVVFGGGRLWVADEDGAGVTAVDAKEDRVLKRGIAPHATPLRLAAGAGAIWASSASTGSVRRIDLGTAAAGAPILVGRGPAGVTVGGGLVWVANSRAGTVTRVDPSIRAIFGDPISVGPRPGGIDAGTESVWVANAADATVTRIGIEDGEAEGDPIDVGPDPGAIAVGDESIWVANNGDGTVTRIQP
jgi:Protein kinase domain